MTARHSTSVTIAFEFEVTEYALRRVIVRHQFSTPMHSASELLHTP